MLIVSDRWLDAVRNGGSRVDYAEIVDTRGQIILSLPIESGSVKVNFDDATRRTFSAVVTVEDSSIIPTTAGDPLNIYGSLVTIRSGFAFQDGSEEVVPMGLFVLERNEVEQDDSNLTMTLTGSDMSVKISGNSSTPVSFPGGTVEDCVRALVNARYRDVVFSLGDSGYSVPAMFWDVNTDLWSEARRIMLEGAGKDLAFGRNGTCDANSLINVAQDAYVWEFTEGIDTETILRVRRDLNSEDFHNGVIVTSKVSGLNIRAEAWDMDPRSSTYRYGQFGEHPLSVESETVTTSGQAVESAANILALELGVSDGIEFEALNNPAHDIGDIFTANRPTIGTTGKYMMQDLEVPFGSELMRVSGRRRV